MTLDIKEASMSAVRPSGMTLTAIWQGLPALRRVWAATDSSNGFSSVLSIRSERRSRFSIDMERICSTIPFSFSRDSRVTFR